MLDLHFNLIESHTLIKYYFNTNTNTLNVKTFWFVVVMPTSYLILASRILAHFIESIDSHLITVILSEMTFQLRQE